MKRKSAVGHLRVLRPCQKTLLGHLVHQGQQVKVTLDQHRPRALVTAVFGSPLADGRTLVLGNRVESILAGLAAGQHVGGVKLAAGATAVGFSALAAEQVKGALDHRLGALETAQGVGQRGISAPELLAEFGKVGAQSESLIYITIQIGKLKTVKK